jgi:hypothetical protein
VHIVGACGHACIIVNNQYVRFVGRILSTRLHLDDISGSQNKKKAIANDDLKIL